MRRSILAVVLIAVIAAASMTAFTQSNSQQKKAAEQAKDPVCGLTVDKNPELSHNHKGESFYFCSKADMEKFKKEPEKYTKKK